MKLSQFKFELPEELIAQEPLKTRHDARLLVVDRKTQKIEHRKFHDLLDIFNEDDVFVVNDTKVFTARMYGQKEKTGAQIEVFLLRELNHELRLWDVLVDPAIVNTSFTLFGSLKSKTKNSSAAVSLYSCCLMSTPRTQYPSFFKRVTK